MGNHCIDCKFCGRDQRVVGDHCCPEYVAEQEQARLRAETARKAEEDYLSRFGLEPFDGKLYARDVIAMLKKREGKVLKPGRRKPKSQPVFYDD